MLGVIRSTPSACALAFGVPRLFTAPSIQGRILSGGPRSRPIDTLRCFQTRRRTLCVWAAATEAVLDSDRTELQAEELEHELDAMEAQDENGGDGDEEEPSGEPPSPARLSLLQSNIQILKRDCGVAQLLLDAATSRADSLYLGLDISTQSTGYAVLRPSALHTSTINTIYNSVHSINGDDGVGGIDSGHSASKELLRAAGLAGLLEWGCIAGSGSGSKKKDVVDVGVIVEETLRDVAARCRPSSAHDSAGGGEGGEGAPSLSPPRLSPQSKDDEVGQDGLGVNGSAGMFLPGSEGGEEGPAWVVGVEDFMRRFLPGRSNAKSIFALAQLNGIVKYACQKHLGVKVNSFHPSTPRSFYGLTRNKPEGKEMKHIVHDFATSQEDGALESRYEWPLLSDGSKADGCYDITDAYLVALYSWHRDLFRAVADNKLAKDRFAEAFRLQHANNLAAAEERSMKLYMEGNMPAARGKKMLKPMTERSARNAHRKVQDARFTKAYETALTHWFKQRVLGADL
ncbi:unnamed protein product [Laminaria digitata]